MLGRIMPVSAPKYRWEMVLLLLLPLRFLGTKSLGCCQCPASMGDPRVQGAPVLLGDSADAGRAALGVNGPRCSGLVVLRSLRRCTLWCEKGTGGKHRVCRLCVCACACMHVLADWLCACVCIGASSMVLCVCVCALAGQLGMPRCVHAYR